jgi:3-hydroxyisobutyrate dehydrogenase-like beta-hydroxyacid dehydrogenase
MRIALIAAGEMGAAVARLLVGAGHDVCSVLRGRSARTRQRALAAGVQDAPALGPLLEQAQVALSIVPPAAAVGVAQDCARSGLPAAAVYVDLNAIAPTTAREVGRCIEACGATCVDGGIVGPAPRVREDARLYLSGPRAPALASLGGALDLRWIGEEIGLASALKLCFAASTKAASALHLTLLAAAERAGVRSALMDEFAISQPQLGARLAASLPNVPARAHRWVGEMRELAAFLAECGLPAGAAHAAAEDFVRAAVLPWSGAAPEDMDARPGLDALVEAFARACPPT